MENKLNKRLVFVKSYEPYDFTKNMGQYGVEIIYTDGSTQMLTTKSTLSNVYASSDFDTDDEYFEFLNLLKQSGIPRT